MLSTLFLCRAVAAAAAACCCCCCCCCLLLLLLLLLLQPLCLFPWAAFSYLGQVLGRRLRGLLYEGTCAVCCVPATAACVTLAQVWELKTGDIVSTGRAHSSAVEHLAWAPDEKQLVSLRGKRLGRGVIVFGRRRLRRMPPCAFGTFIWLETAS